MEKQMRTAKDCEVRSAPALHGEKIGTIFMGQVIKIDDQPHDGWVHVIGPNPPINPDGTYLRRKEPAYVELAHLEELVSNKTYVQLEIDWTAKTFKIT
jgi:hypothetical protein